MNRILRTPVATLLAAGLLTLATSSWEAHAQAPLSPPPEISFAVNKLLEENAEGPNVERTYFSAGSKKIVFGLPKDCRLSPAGDHLTILLTDTGLDGEIHVARSPFSKEMDLAAEALKYREAAAKDLPGGATNIEVQQPVLNPYPFNGWKSLGFTWTYSSSGRSMVRTVSFINLEFGTQIMVTTLSVKKDSEKVSKLARDFMGSWWVKG